MPLVTCPHCGVDTPDRQVNCYFCHKPRHEKPVPPDTSERPQQALHVAPINETPNPPRPADSEAEVYKNWWYLFLGLLIFQAILFGNHTDASPGMAIVGGISYSLFVGLIVLVVCAPITWLIRLLTGTKWHALAPAVATGIISIAVLAGLGGSFIELKGGGDCADGGRYGEYSSC